MTDWWSVCCTLSQSIIWAEVPSLSTIKRSRVREHQRKYLSCWGFQRAWIAPQELQYESRQKSLLNSFTNFYASTATTSGDWMSTIIAKSPKRHHCNCQNWQQQKVEDHGNGLRSKFSHSIHQYLWNWECITYKPLIPHKSIRFTRSASKRNIYFRTWHICLIRWNRDPPITNAKQIIRSHGRCSPS